MSRYINPKDVEDREYLIGVPEDSVTPAADETLFGVWVRVQNESGTKRSRRPTPGRSRTPRRPSYEPVEIDTDINPFAFEAIDVQPNTVLPLASSAAGQGPTQGLLLLFKLKTESLQNRPLELRFSTAAAARPARTTSTCRGLSPFTRP